MSIQSQLINHLKAQNGSEEAQNLKLVSNFIYFTAASGHNILN
jgi:hypothetical protein